MAKKPERYLIWSIHHRLWWRQHSAGYASTIEDAGRYSRESAIDICVPLVPAVLMINIPVREEDVLAVMMPVLRNRKSV